MNSGFWTTPIHEQDITPEELYQAFKERLISEVVAEVDYCQTEHGDRVWLETINLVDKEQK